MPDIGGQTTRIAVAAESPYDVVIGRRVLADVWTALPEETRRVAVVYSPRQRLTARAVAAELRSAGFDARELAVPDGERAKSVEVAASCWQRLAADGFTRSDALVGVGGGATTDLTGFVAGTFLRGVPCVLAPTTLLGMVDAAVGGKTGINLAAGKNLVGTFSEPLAVFCDLDTLATLPTVEVASGLAEVIKCGLIADPEILRLVETDPAAALNSQSSTLRALVERSVAVKAAVVSADLREATSVGGAVGRESLNYGHTLAHAIERVEGYTVRHGAAVSIGMVYVAELARLAGLLSSVEVQRHRDLLESVTLPTSYAPDRWEPLHAAMRLDKKSRGDRLRFVALKGLGRPVVLEAPDTDLLAAAYERISATRASR